MPGCVICRGFFLSAVTPLKSVLDSDRALLLLLHPSVLLSGLHSVALSQALPPLTPSPTRQR